MTTTMTVVGAALVQGLLGFGLLAFGRWSVSAADRLIPDGLTEEERASRRRSYLIGARVCQLIGVALLVFTVATGVAALAGVEPTLRPQ